MVKVNKDEGRMMKEEFGFPRRRPVCVLREKEVKQFGEYRTRRLELDVWDSLEQDE